MISWKTFVIAVLLGAIAGLGIGKFAPESSEWFAYLIGAIVFFTAVRLGEIF